MKTKMDKTELLRKYGIVLMLLLLIVYFSFGSKYFLTGGNIVNVLRQSAVTGISAVGLTYVMLTGGIDLSIGAVIGLTAVTAASLMAKVGMNPVLACIIALLLGILIGFINGILINYVEIPALIATLGVMTSVRGLCYILTGGLPVYGFPTSFDVLGKDRGLFAENLFPFAVCQYIHIFIAHVNINGIISVCSAKSLYKL